MIRSGSEGQGPRVRVQGAGAQRSGLKGLSEAQGEGSKRLGSKRLGSKRLGSKRLGANGQVPRGGDQGSWVEGPGHVPLKFSIIYYLTLIIPFNINSDKKSFLSWPISSEGRYIAAIGQ